MKKEMPPPSTLKAVQQKVRIYNKEETMQLGLHPATVQRIRVAMQRIESYTADIARLTKAIEYEHRIVAEMQHNEIARESLTVSALSPEILMTEDCTAISFKLPPTVKE